MVIIEYFLVQQVGQYPLVEHKTLPQQQQLVAVNGFVVYLDAALPQLWQLAKIKPLTAVAAVVCEHRCRYTYYKIQAHTQTHTHLTCTHISDVVRFWAVG